ncbi:MAG TPA: type II secretion system major pseudopilin GspG [Gemmatimonadota bacterium]
MARFRQGRSADASRGVARAGAAGFTLIEIMVVVIIIGLLAVLVAPRVIGRLSTAKDKAARAQIELFGTALDSYRLDNGVYPTTQQGLEALWSRPTTAPAPRNWTGPYLRKRVPPDPWGNAYVYRSPGEANPDSYDLVSLGRDGAPGGEGEDADLRSWE